jgi:hypothetical protein
VCLQECSVCRERDRWEARLRAQADDGALPDGASASSVAGYDANCDTRSVASIAASHAPSVASSTTGAAAAAAVSTGGHTHGGGRRAPAARSAAKGAHAHAGGGDALPSLQRHGGGDGRGEGARTGLGRGHEDVAPSLGAVSGRSVGGGSFVRLCLAVHFAASLFASMVSPEVRVRALISKALALVRQKASALIRTHACRARRRRATLRRCTRSGTPTSRKSPLETWRQRARWRARL